MQAQKIYSKPLAAVLNAVNDIAELQKSKPTFSDTSRGIIRFIIEMYSFEWEICFTVTDSGGKCCVQLEIEGDSKGIEKMVKREFALLDSLLDTGTRDAGSTP